MDSLDPFISGISSAVPIKDTCRTCLVRNGEMQCLYDGVLVDMLEDVTSIKAQKDDNLPNSICLQCIHKLNVAYNFKKSSKENDGTLRMMQGLDFNVETILNCDETMGTDVITDETLQIASNIEEDYIEFDTPFEPVIHITDGFSLPQNLIELEQAYSAFTDEERDKQNEEKKNEIDHQENIQLAGVIPEFILGDGLGNIITTLQETNETEINEWPLLELNSVESFESMSEQKAHAVQHPNTCTTCGKTFILKRSLYRHVKIHSDNWTEVCHICDKKFSDKSNLRSHTKTHTGELRNVKGKPYLCSECGQSFKWSSSLIKHSRYHTGKNLHECKLCPKKYAERRSLKLHMRHHDGEKPYGCDICSQRFNHHSNLNRHKRKNHTSGRSFTCKECGKHFPQQQALDVHMGLHTRERPHVCSICKKSFFNSNHLTTHIRSHTGEKPFVCTLCNKKFVTSSHLKSHSKIHEKGSLFV